MLSLAPFFLEVCLFLLNSSIESLINVYGYFFVFIRYEGPLNAFMGLFMFLEFFIMTKSSLYVRITYKDY